MNTILRLLRTLALYIGLVLLTGVVAVLLFILILPRAANWEWLSRFPVLNPLRENVTVIEKTEQIVLSEEEGWERFMAEPATAVVSIVSVPTTRTMPQDIITTRATGVLMTNDGLLATYSGQAPATENRRFTVFFTDGNVSVARFVWYDTLLNIAYYRTDRQDTPSIAFANSDDIRTGRRYVALGATMDERNGMLSPGVIGTESRTYNLSGKTVASTDEWEGVFLPDRELESNFVGGAAVAMNGEMIGLIGSMLIDNKTETFVLPANALRQSLQRLANRERSPERVFGAYYITLTKETALLYGLARDRGALIYSPSGVTGLSVIDGSVAERMGLLYGDIVIAVNGREINLDLPLSVALAETTPGENVTLLVIRGGQEIKLTALY